MAADDQCAAAAHPASAGRVHALEIALSLVLEIANRHSPLGARRGVAGRTQRTDRTEADRAALDPLDVAGIGPRWR